MLKNNKPSSCSSSSCCCCYIPKFGRAKLSVITTHYLAYSGSAQSFFSSHQEEEEEHDQARRRPFEQEPFHVTIITWALQYLSLFHDFHLSSVLSMSQLNSSYFFRTGRKTLQSATFSTHCVQPRAKCSQRGRPAQIVSLIGFCFPTRKEGKNKNIYLLSKINK